MMDHSAICAFACASESPKFPTSSMSGSFHAPGPCAASMPLASAWSPTCSQHEGVTRRRGRGAATGSRSPTQSTMPLTDS